MTTAKPKPMAGQTDTADDLIAELARLMAEDAQSEKPKTEPKPVRIPGEPTPAVPPVSVNPQQTPVPRLDAAPGQDGQAVRQEPPQVQPSPPPVRIPGQAPTPMADARPTKFTPDRPTPKAEAPQRIEPVAEISRSEPRPTPVPSASREPPVATRQEPAFGAMASRETIAPVAPPADAPAAVPVAPAADLPELDQDSLADLIAAELASEIDAPRPQPDESDAQATKESVEPVRDNDVFGVPPVFGLASAPPSKAPMADEPSASEVEPAAVQPSIDDVIAQAQAVEMAEPVVAKSEPDPLDEIERLIGPAVRGEHRQQAPSPALRSLATPTLPAEPKPTPASERLRAPSIASVDDAILAAAATSGARVEWVEPEIEARIGDADDAVAPRARKRKVLGMTRSLAGPVVAMSLLAVAALGLYAVLGLGSGAPDGPAPLLVADTTPVKEIATPDPEASQANQSVVFNEIAGGNTGENEQLVSRDQTDEAAVSAFVPNSGNDEGLVNRKVRTVTVRPDGTIVSGSDGVAGATMLPVDRPDVPEVPGADFSTPELIGSVDPSATAAENAAAAAAAAAPTVVPVQPGSFVPAVDVAGNPIAGKTAPVPRLRPTNLPTVAAVTPAATTPAATPTPTSTPAPVPEASTPAAQASAVTSAVTSAPAYVQLSSQRSEEAARQTAQSIASRFGPLFGGANLEVQRVDLGERGIFYRVRVPADSLQSANTLCNNVKAAGGDCFTM